MADCSTFDEGMFCQKLGVDLIGSTCPVIPVVPCRQSRIISEVIDLAKAGCRVMAEGRYNTPELAKKR